jgi:hypothetical protein
VMQLANTLYTAELITAEEAQFGLGRYADKFMADYQQHMSSNNWGFKEEAGGAKLGQFLSTRTSWGYSHWWPCSPG